MSAAQPRVCEAAPLRAALRSRMRTIVIASALVLLGGCGSEDPPAPMPRPEPTSAPAAAGSPPAAASPDAAPSPGVRPDGSIVSAVPWFHGSLEEALAKAKAEGKLVLADVGAYWCPPCHRLDEEVFVLPKVGEAIASRFVAVHIDAEKGEGPEVAERYRVQAFPTVLVLESTGVEKGRFVDFLPEAELLAALDRIASGGNVLGDLEARVAENPDDLKARYELGNAWLLAAKPEAAKAHLDAVLVADPKNEMGLASKVLYDRAMMQTYKIDRDLPGAIEAYRELQARFPESKEATRAYRQIGRILAEQERPAEAIASLQAMIATDPDDPSLKSSFGWFSFREKCEPQAGLAAVDAGIAQAPEDAELQYLRAELLHLLRRDEEALVAIRKASELEPLSAYYRRQVRRFEAIARGEDPDGAAG
jgi:thioredoxin-like negative regulator of GroEL